MIPAWIRIDDDTAVAEARRLAVNAAAMEALNERQTGAVAVVASEIATNLRKHAQGGEMQISRLSSLGVAGVEMLSIDRGPGIPDLAKVLADGYSSSATAGTGLGAMRRMSDGFDVYSQAGKGTALVSRICREKAGPASDLFPASAVLLPKKGEEVCGDSWAIRRDPHRAMLMVADGLGHGPFAAQASEKAAGAFLGSGSADPATVLDQVHRALHSTRGAAVAIATIEWSNRRVRYSGLGNITGVVVGGEKDQHMVSHNGTAGHEARTMREFEYPLPQRGMVIMHSDGLTSNWNLRTYPALIQRDPALVAGTLYRDTSRERDDVCVLAVRF